MGMGMNHWEWEGIGLKKDIPFRLYGKGHGISAQWLVTSFCER